ncbi:MAG: hypothetical protein M1820_003985 [Bogoriella megaspora]|nr:MAG: hypothetical protein M1820_003985 [Bogoriella megaspora]
MQYAPLNSSEQEIRLLEVFSDFEPTDESASHLQCRMRSKVRKVSLLSPELPKYKALSYTWINDRVKVSRNEAPVSINPNLMLALMHISRGKEILIWADALCINQEDDLEKSSQVAIMHRIFRSAEEVIAWIHPDPSYIRAIRFVQDWASLWNSTYESRETTKPIEIFDEARRAIPQATTPHALHDLRACLTLDRYWTRAWIFQELNAGSNVRLQCGHCHIPLTSLLRAEQLWSLMGESNVIYDLTINTRENLLRSATSNTMYWSDIFYSLCTRPMSQMFQLIRGLNGVSVDGSGTLSTDLLERFSFLNAGDPIDKVFALWGYVSPEKPYSYLIRPDYTLDVEIVYIRAAQYLILTAGNLSLLNSCPKVPQQRSSQLPSWVPDWSMDTFSPNPDARDSISSIHVIRPGSDASAPQAEKTKPTYELLVSRQNSSQVRKDTKSFIESRFLASMITFQIDDRALQVKGLKIDTVLTVVGGDVFPFPSNESGSATLQRFIEHIFDNSSQNRGRVFDQYLRYVFSFTRQPDSMPLNLQPRSSGTVVKLQLGRYNTLQDGARLPVEEKASANSQTFVQLSNQEYSAVASDLEYISFFIQLISESIEASDKNTTEDHDDVVVRWCRRLCHVLLGKEASLPAVDDLVNLLLDPGPPVAFRAKLGLLHQVKHRRMLTQTPRKKFIITSNGFFGACSNSVFPAPGDILFNLPTLPKPFILRPKGKEYTRVGECFLMDKQDYDLNNPEDIENLIPELPWLEIV